MCGSIARMSPLEQLTCAAADIALAHAGDRRVDGDDERRVTGGACTRDRRFGDVAAAAAR